MYELIAVLAVCKASLHILLRIFIDIHQRKTNLGPTLTHLLIFCIAHKAALNARAEEAARLGLPAQQQSAHELDATDTYKIFSALMNVTGEGDKDDLGILGKFPR